MTRLKCWRFFLSWRRLWKRRAEKQLTFMVELQQKARKQEQEHEEKMVGMMMSMMQQTMTMFAERYSVSTHPPIAPGSEFAVS